MSYYTSRPSRQERPQRSYERLLGYGERDPRECKHGRYTPPPLNPYRDAYDICEAEDRALDDLVSRMHGLSPQDRTYAILYARCAHHFPNAVRTFPVPEFATSVPSSTAAFSLQMPTAPAAPARQPWNAPPSYPTPDSPHSRATFGHLYPSPSMASPDEWALLELIQGVSKHRMSSDHEVVDYYECFVYLSWPVYVSRPTRKQDRDMWFWHGFHPEDRKVLLRHLRAKYPNRPRGVFFDYRDVRDAGYTVFYRRRSWEHLLEQDRDPRVWDSDDDKRECSWLPSHNQHSQLTRTSTASSSAPHSRPKGPRVPHIALRPRPQLSLLPSCSATSQPSTLAATSTHPLPNLPPPPSPLDLAANLPPPCDPSSALLPSPPGLLSSPLVAPLPLLRAASPPSPLATSLSSPVLALPPSPPAASLPLLLPCLPSTTPENRLEEECPKITKIDKQNIASAKKQQQPQPQGPRERAKRRRQTQQYHAPHRQRRHPLQQHRRPVHARALAHTCHWHLKLRRPRRRRSDSFHIAKARLTGDGQFLIPQQV
ncbi:hypothetical protein BC827DRAFT_1378797 [Russula dissimulans]|nr:hypothetical protein BC827DRAFT_1378797 [Russula dissimulans]